MEQKNPEQTPAPNGQQALSQSELQQIYPTPGQSPRGIEPVPVSPGRSSGFKRGLILLLIIIVAAGGFAGWKFVLNKPDKLASKSAAGNSQPAAVVSEKNNYEVFQSPGPGTGYTYSLVFNSTGKKAQTGISPVKLEVITPVGFDSFLLLDPSSSDKMSYYLFSTNGLKALTGLPSSLTVPSTERDNGPIGIKGYGSNNVIYQYCPPNTATQDCDVRIVNLNTGSEKTFKVDQINTYSAHLSTLSSDQKSAYFIGVSPANVSALQEQADKITGGNPTFADDPNSQALYKLTVTRSVMQLDLASQKVVSIKPATTQYTYYGKFWISPNGQNLLYSNGGESGELQYVRISDNKQEVIKLPKATYSTEPFGTTTTTYDPLFSPDGKYMAFVTYDTANNMLESAGVINFADLSVKIIASEQAGQVGSTTGYFNNFRWIADNQFDFTAGTSNYTYKIGDNTDVQTGSDFGSLVGIADGFH